MDSKQALYEVGDQVDLRFTAAVVAEVGVEWLRFQTATAEFVLDADAVDCQITKVDGDPEITRIWATEPGA